MTTSSGSASVAYFSEMVPDAATLRLAAAVAWRGVPAPTALLGGGGPLGWLRGLRHRLWLRLGPLGYDVSVGDRPLFGGPPGAPPRVSRGSLGLAPHGEPLAYYDEGSRMLRVLGRVLAVPPADQTLVGLIDAMGSHGRAPRLVLRVVPTPSIMVPQVGPPSPGAEGHSHVVAYFVSEHPAWTAALRADPIVRGFLDGEGTR